MICTVAMTASCWATEPRRTGYSGSRGKISITSQVGYMYICQIYCFIWLTMYLVKLPRKEILFNGNHSTDVTEGWSDERTGSTGGQTDTEMDGLSKRSIYLMLLIVVWRQDFSALCNNLIFVLLAARNVVSMYNGLPGHQVNYQLGQHLINQESFNNKITAIGFDVIPSYYSSKLYHL